MPDLLQERPLILIIEDSPNDLRLLSSLVKDQGEIIFATDGKQGIQFAISRVPDLILLDVELPDIDGYEVCRNLKSNAETGEIPVIFVTSHTKPRYEVAALEAGAIDFISKPFNPPIICARVKTHLTLKRQTDLLHSLAEKDGLTSVFNRRYFDERTLAEWKRHMRQGQPLALALLDVDHFKQYNDGYGHSQGDQCLRRISAELVKCTRRPGEFVARYGGEEFVCLLPNNSEDEATKFGEYICQQIQLLDIPHHFSKVAKCVTVSVGVSSIIPNQELNLHDIINAADTALYQAKHEGRNRCVCYRAP